MRNKAVFLDRDGVINRERDDYTFLLEDFVILDDVLDCLKKWHDKGYLIIIISNQGGIGKGIYNHSEVIAINNLLKQKFFSNGIAWTDLFYCPHHPDHSGKCLCRKPDSLLFEKALAKHRIDASFSFMIGDRERDIVAAEKAGIRGFLIESNSTLKKLLSLIP